MRRSRLKGHNCRDLKAGMSCPLDLALPAHLPATAAKEEDRGQYG